MKTNKNDKQEKPQGKNTAGKHILQNHYTGASASESYSPEPTMRSATTDSSRMPKNSNDDLPTGGNIR